MKLYYVNHGEDGESAFPTLKAAEAKARELLAECDHLDELEIEHCEVVQLTRANLCYILNSSGGSWQAGESEIVKTIRRRKKAASS